MNRAALTSYCGTYRYQLIREWDETLPMLCVIMLNPSTADALRDDHTITKLIEFVRRLGFGSINVVNLFAYRATSPKVLKAAGFPVGPDNAHHIISAVSRCAKTLCAWGSNAAGHAQERMVRETLRLCDVRTFALRINSDGTPAHPLMLPYTCTL